MPSAPLFGEELLYPISSAQPAGADLRWTAEWDRIREARRADDGLQLGKWAKKEQKSADWRAVWDSTLVLLGERSKDLQLSLWLTEAGIHLHGFAGLRDGLRLTRELVARFWDSGLHPAMEDGPEDRSGPFEWLNGKLADSIAAIPITAREDSGDDYSLIDLKEARRVGSEAACKTADGDVDDKKKKAYDAAVAQGRVSLDLFNAAVKGTTRERYEFLAADFQAAAAEFKALEKSVDEKFGDVAPNLAAFRAGMADLEQEIAAILDGKRQQQPAILARAAAVGAGPSPAPTDAAPRPVATAPSAGAVDAPAPLSSTRDSWKDAEDLVRSGQVETGLAAMTRLAAAETSGRKRFQRRMLLAEVCLSSKRDKLARSILEQLAEQIESCHLQEWESSELIGAVWGRLIQLYRKSEDSSDAERAGKLYEQLCRLDPWQALHCGD